MSFEPAQAIDLPSRNGAPLSAIEVQERLQLREGLRLRRSVDHFARAWYGGILSLILSGLAVKLFVDSQPTARTGAAPAASTGLLSAIALLAILALAGWTFSLVYFFRSRRTAQTEGGMLRRLQDLDERSPKPPELF